MKLLDQETLPELFETLTEWAAKSAEDLELFDERGLLDAMPMGKIVKFLGTKMMTINDPAKALKKLLGVAGFKTLVDALRNYEINPVVKELFVHDVLPGVKQLLRRYENEIDAFDWAHFNSNTICKYYTDQIMGMVSPLLDDRREDMVRGYFDRRYKLTCLELMNGAPIVYKKLKDRFNNSLYAEAVNGYKYEQYRIALKEQFNEIVLNDNKDMRLCDIYIEPGYAIHKHCYSENVKLQRALESVNDKDFVNSEKPESAHDFAKQFVLSDEDKRLKSKNAQLLFLLGYPGQGKTSFCKKLLHDSIDGSRCISNPVFFVRFKTIVDTIELINAPLESLEKHIRERINFKLEKDLFDNSLLVLDGLDELFIKEAMNNNAIDEFCRLIIADIKQRPGMKVIITSRYGYINLEQLRSEHALIVQLRELSPDQQKEWLMKYRCFHPETSLTAGKLDDIQKKAKYLKELVCQPILLHMIATLNGEIDLNVNRANIYDNLYTQLISRSWDGEQIDALKGANEENLRELLRNIAFAIYKSGKEYIHKSTLADLPATKEFIEKLDNKAFQHALKRIMIAFYFQETKKEEGDEILTDKHDYAIEFLHKSLQEYLVAEYIWLAMQNFVEKRGRTNKYIVDDDERALADISKLFSMRLLSDEIRTYIVEIIDNDSQIDKVELCARLERFLPYCLDQQFFTKLIEFPKNVTYASFTNFYGYWFIISHLGQKRNLVTDTQKENFSYFLRQLDGSNGINLAYQYFNMFDLRGINFSGSNLSHADFSKCRMERCLFDRAILFNTSFIETNLSFSIFSTAMDYKMYSQKWDSGSATIVDRCIFKRAICFGTNFMGCELKDCSFASSIISHAIFKWTVVEPKCMYVSIGYDEVLDFSADFIAEINKLRKGADFKQWNSPT